MAPTDEELLELMPQGFRDDLALVSRMASHGAGPEVQPGLFRVTLNTGALDYARAVWDRARALLAQPEPPAAGEVGELARSLHHASDALRSYALHGAAEAWTRAADLLEQRHPAPVPVASDTRYEFSVYDEDYTEQVGGSAPTYVQALSEGQRYFAQYQQDGPHTLEVRRVENLNPDAFSVPDDAPLPVLPEGTQVIEPAERIILAPVPAPVPVSERLPGPEDCDAEGRCWAGWNGLEIAGWTLCRAPEQFDADDTHWLPATALPLPGGEEE